MTSVHVTYVSGDDWVGLYVNDQLFAEGHSIAASIIGEIVDWKGAITSFQSFQVDSAWLENEGSFPPNVDFIPDEVRF